MIPKIIHYCWLSNDPKPKYIQQCIASWKKYLPEYTIRLWDISSMDYNAIPFTRDALANRKWPFVSDYVRLYALYHEGGIYLDSDVRAFGKLDDLLESDFFSGLEMRDKEHTQIYMEAAIMGAIAGHPFVKQCLDLYNQRSFVGSDGAFDLTPIPTILSEIMEKDYGWKREDRTQHLSDGITIYATDTIANSNCPLRKSVKLYHLNSRSWIATPWMAQFLRDLKRKTKLFFSRF